MFDLIWKVSDSKYYRCPVDFVQSSPNSLKELELRKYILELSKLILAFY